MIALLKISTSISILVTLFSMGANAQTKGFIGSRNALSFDFSSLTQQEINLQYNVHLKKHQVLTVNLSRQNISDGVLYNQEGDSVQINLTHNNNGIGLGFIINNKKLKMPMPIGFYYGLCFQRHWGKLNQSIDGSMLDTYLHQSYLPAIILGRGMAISPRFYIDLSVNTGIKFGKYFLKEEASYNIPPLAIYPYNLPFVKPKINMTERDSKTYTYQTFYAMPGVKMGFLF